MPTTSDRLPTSPAPTIPEPEHEAPAPEALAGASAPALTPNSVAFVWSDRLWQERGYPGGLPAGSLLRTYRLLEALGALHWREVTLCAPQESLGDAEGLQQFHHDDYIQAVMALSQGQASPWAEEAFGFEGLLGAVPLPLLAEQAALHVASTRTALQQLREGQAMRGMALTGSQVYARRAQARQGAIFNDVLLPLLDARAAGERVAFLNLDASHPTLVQEHFYEDPDFLFLSLHEDPHFLYPGSGFLKETGQGAGQGRTVNCPLPSGAGDGAYLWVLDALFLPLLKRFEPTLLVVLGGTSAHFTEPLAHLSLSSQGYQQLLERLCEGHARMLYLGGWGSDMDVSARLWALTLAVLAQRVPALPQSLPARYARHWGEGTLHDLAPSQPLPLRRYVERHVQQTLAQLQRALFPRWELPITVEELEPDSPRPFYARTPSPSAGEVTQPPPYLPAADSPPVEGKDKRGRQAQRQRQERGGGRTPAPAASTEEEQAPKKKRRRRRRRDNKGEKKERGASSQEQGGRSRKRRGGGKQ